MAISALLGIGLTTANAANTINNTRRQVKQDANAEADRKLNRANAELRLKQGQAQLEQIQHKIDQFPQQDQILANQLQESQMQLKQLKGKVIRDETFRGLNNFFDSGDPNTLNQFFKDYKDDPTVQTMFHGAIKMDRIDMNNPEDKSLFRKAGISDAELDAADGKKDGKIDFDKLKKRYVKTTNNQGETKITDMLVLASATGYSRYATDQKLKQMQALADITKTQKGTPTSLERDANAVVQARKDLEVNPNDERAKAIIAEFNKKIQTTNMTKTSDQKNAEAVGAAQARIDAGKGTATDRALLARQKSKNQGTAAGRLDAAVQARQNFNTEGFNKLSQAELQKSPRARELVNIIELAHGITPKQQQEFINLGSLVALGKESSTLSASQTGAFDRLTSGALTYVSNEVKDRETRATYGAFINEFRHNLFGSALTDGELKAFKDAYASDKQKIGPVLAGLRAAMLQVQSKLQTLTNLNDPIVMKFRVGKTLEDAQATVDTIDKRLAFYNAVSNGKTPDEAQKEVFGKSTVPPKEMNQERILNAIFGGK